MKQKTIPSVTSGKKIFISKDPSKKGNIWEQFLWCLEWQREAFSNVAGF